MLDYRMNDAFAVRRLLTALVLAVCLCHLPANAEDTGDTGIEENTTTKAGRICSVLEGVDMTRLISSNTRSFFAGSIEDVELVREYVSESMASGGLADGFHNLDDLAATLDAGARNLTATTTVEAGLGWVDDRRDRRIERYVSQSANEPWVGTKQDDLAAIESVVNVFPWIVDRRSVERLWWLDHQNGRSEGPQKEPFHFEQLYVAAWIGTYGEAWMYYPPLAVYGHPFGFGDVLGATYDSHEEEFVRPNLPANNPERRAYFTAPYPDTAQPGLSLITALAPIYYTGQWRDNTYDNTYLASTGVDIAVSAVSTLLQDLEGTMSAGSFAFLVDMDFNVVVISQQSVDKIYPSRTGWEGSRVTYDLADGSVADDRRNQTYLPSDTILQSPTNLTNADWKALHEHIKTVNPGERGFDTLNITLRGSASPEEFYVMYERWPSVADWVLVSFAPTKEIQHAIDVGFERLEIIIEKSPEDVAQESVLFVNRGILDVTVRLEKLPTWIKLLEPIDDLQKVAAGQNLSLALETSNNVTGTTSALITIEVQDDDYPDCFFQRTFSTTVTVKVIPPYELNQLGIARLFGFILAGLVVVTSAGFSLWVWFYRAERVVKAAQPFFLHLLCCGTFIMGVAIVPLGFDDEIVDEHRAGSACLAFPWFFVTGFSLAFSTLFSKIWRINRVVEASLNFRRQEIRPQDVLAPLLIILSMNFALLLIWTLIDPPRWTRVNTSEFTSYGTCWTNDDSNMASTIIFWLLLVVNFVAVALANFEAYKARDLADEFSESKFIGMAMASMLQVVVIAIPLLFLVGETPQAFYIVQSLIVATCALSLLLLIFIPKVLHLKHNKPMPRRATIDGRRSSALGRRTSLEGQWGNDSHVKTSSYLGNSSVEETSNNNAQDQIGTASSFQKSQPATNSPNRLSRASSFRSLNQNGDFLSAMQKDFALCKKKLDILEKTLREQGLDVASLYDEKIPRTMKAYSGDDEGPSKSREDLEDSQQSRRFL